MKKVYLSVPMKGRTKENIEKSLRKMREYTRIALGEDVEFINTEVKEQAPKGANEAVWCLGQSISLMSHADILVCVDAPYWIQSKGCAVEKRVFQDYINHYNDNDDIRYIELPAYLIIDPNEWKELYDNYTEEEKRMNENPVRSCCSR